MFTAPRDCTKDSTAEEEGSFSRLAVNLRLPMLNPVRRVYQRGRFHFETPGRQECRGKANSRSAVRNEVRDGVGMELRRVLETPEHP